MGKDARPFEAAVGGAKPGPDIYSNNARWPVRTSVQDRRPL